MAARASGRKPGSLLAKRHILGLTERHIFGLAERHIPPGAASIGAKRECN